MSAVAIGIRSRTQAIFAGSPTIGPSGVALPMASPHTTALNASINRSRCGRFDAERPRRGAHGESESAEEENPPEVPADLPEAAPDFSWADGPYEPCEQRGSGECGDQADGGNLAPRRCRGHGAII